MTFGETLVYHRNRLGISQKELASRLNITPTRLNYWEKDKRQPDVPMIKELASALHVSADVLIGTDPQSYKSKPLDPSEIEHLEKYRELDTYGKDMVDTVLNKEYDRHIIESKIKAVSINQHPRLVSFIVYDDPAAAGSPLDANSAYTRIDFPEDVVPTEADFGVRISGRSMEPTIPDGSIAFVRRAQTATNGDIVIAWVDGEGMVCKRAVCNGDQLVKLQSDNTAYADIDGHRLNGLVVYGKVVKSITPQ